MGSAYISFQTKHRRRNHAARQLGASPLALRRKTPGEPHSSSNGPAGAGWGAMAPRLGMGQQGKGDPREGGQGSPGSSHRPGHPCKRGLRSGAGDSRALGSGIAGIGASSISDPTGKCRVRVRNMRHADIGTNSNLLPGMSARNLV